MELDERLATGRRSHHRPLHADRLHQVVDRVEFERLHRVLVERRGEYHDRRMRELEQVPGQFHAVHVRHVDVGQHQVRRRALQQFQRLAAMLRFADDRQRQRRQRNRPAGRAAAFAPALRRPRSARAAASQARAASGMAMRADASRESSFCPGIGPVTVGTPVAELAACVR